MSRVVDYIFKGHDGVTPAIKKMLREQKKFNAAARKGVSSIKRATASTAGWLKRELNLRRTLNSEAARYIGLAGGIGFTVLAVTIVAGMSLLMLPHPVTCSTRSP